MNKKRKPSKAVAGGLLPAKLFEKASTLAAVARRIFEENACSKI